jgi:hypothetical protein
VQCAHAIAAIAETTPLFLAAMVEFRHLWYRFGASCFSQSLCAYSEVSFLQNATSFELFHEAFFFFLLFSSAYKCNCSAD